MLKNRIIPCLDVKNGRVVKGINFVNLKDAGDPVEQAKIYSDGGADEICFLDITASNENRDIIYDVVKDTSKKCFVPLTVGGGVRNVNDISKLLKSQKDGKITPGEYVEEYFNLKTRYDKFLLEIEVYAKDVENIVGKSLKYNLYKKFKQPIPKSLQQSNKEIREFIKQNVSPDNPLYEILNKGKSKVKLDAKPMSNDIAMLNTDTRDRETIVIITDSIA